MRYKWFVILLLALVTSMPVLARRRTHTHRKPAGVVALWASHGRYRGLESGTGDTLWLWQRAKQWVTVEDRLTTEYSTRLTDMLRNAGLTVLSPRPDPRTAWGKAIGPSGMPRWMEAALYSLRAQGYPDTVVRYTRCFDTPSEYKDDIYSRPQWVNHLVEVAHQPVDLAIALHTDGLDAPGDSALVGTLALYTGKEHRNLAAAISHQVVQDMRRTIAPTWVERKPKDCRYAECRVPRVPSLILEIASHKDISDVQYLLDPQAMDIVARAIYKGVVRYLYGRKAVFTPLTPDSVRLTRDGLLSWHAVTDSLEPTATADHYIVTDDEGQTYSTRHTHMQFSLSPNREYRFTVCAVNRGGQSRPSVPVAIFTGGEPWVQICNCFTRTCGPTFYFDSLTAGIVPGEWGIADSVSYALVGRQTEYRRTQPWLSDTDNGWGECSTEYEDVLTKGNTKDYHLRHASVWRGEGYSYIATYGVPPDSSIAGTDLISEHPGPIVLAPGECVLTPWGAYPIHTEPNAEVLYCNRAERVTLQAGDRVLGRFRSGLPAIVQRGENIQTTFRLDAVEGYKDLLKHLIHETEKPTLSE